MRASGDRYRGTRAVAGRPRPLFAMAGRFWPRVSQLARAKPMGAIGALLVLILILLAIIGPWIAPYPPLLSVADRLLGPRWDHLFGTDHLGRDQFSRLLVGARPALTLAIVSVVAGAIAGAVVGLVSAFWGGLTDLLVQRLMDALMAMPTLILALALVAALGHTDKNVGLAIAVINFPIANRLIRGAALSLKEEMYVEAARATGASDWRIMGRHIAPNAMGPLLALVTNQVAAAIIIAASLSFLGIGAPPQAPAWGSMLNIAVTEYARLAPWLAISSGLVIFVTVLSFILVGDAARDLLDPRLRSGGGPGSPPRNEL